MDKLEILSKREANKEAKEKSLMDAAYELFLEKGMGNTSVSEIAKKAGIAKGTFYLYFKDKSELEESLIAKITGELFEKALILTRRSQKRTFEEQFIVVMDYLIDYLKENIPLLKFISKNLSYGIYIINDSDDKISKVKSIIDDLYNSYLKDFLVNEASLESPEIVLSLCVELIGSAIYSSIILEKPRPIEEMRPHLHRMVISIFNEYYHK
jgi:AcrR family transcriptional regulator